MQHPPAIRYRRSPHIAAYWDNYRLRLTNLASNRTYSAAPVAVDVLDFCSRWVSIEDVVRRLEHRSSEAIADEIAALTEATMLTRSNQRTSKREAHLRDWGDWIPSAAHFHLATRNVPFADPQRSVVPIVIAREQPAAVKTYAGDHVQLPRFPLDGTLAELLRARRTWRRFGSDAISLDNLSTLCGLTWGVQAWARFGEARPQALKTSPSGGARHSIEAYVCARDVEGLPAGIYHYGPDTHALALVRNGVSAKDIAGFVGGQRYFGEAPLTIFMTSIFERVQWRYPHARSYRNVFIEAGHLAQTFCLLATHLNLAPFCTAAISEDAVEPALGIDGVREGVIYAVGAGTRPPANSWVPLWDGDSIPELVDPAYAARRDDPKGSESS